MNMRMIAARAPALSLPEAALLPALPREWQPLRASIPSNLMIPNRGLHFVPVDRGGRPVDNAARGRGSMAGRAVLRMVQPRD